MSGGDYRIDGVAIDPRTAARMSEASKSECGQTIHDLLTGNAFRLIGSPGGPYQLMLGIEEGRLALQVFLADGTPHGTAILSVSPYRRIVAAYRRQCESFALSVGGAMSPEQIEALDMGRRALHDEGARLLTERLAGKVEMDLATARGLFTLIYHCV
jgi:uncharacterized protein (UPF0262 family)